MPAAFDRVEATLSPARLARYMPAAGGDHHLALRLYVWNSRLCEALYLPLQFAEVASRNAVSIPVARRFGAGWPQNQKFINILSEQMKAELADSVRKEKAKRGAALTDNHIVAALSFGFWVRLMTAAYQNHLWANGVAGSFPNAAKAQGREAIHLKLEQLRKFRNSVAHHYAVFDRGPQAELLNALEIVALVCKDTHWLADDLSRVSVVINIRPKV